MLRYFFFTEKKILVIAAVFASAFLYSAEKGTDAHYKRALDLYNNHQIWLGAIAEARLDLQENPNNLKAYLLIAQIYLKIKEYPRAAEAALSAIERGLENKEAQYLLDNILPAWEKSKSSTDEIVPLYLEIARAHAKVKSFGKAVEYYQKYLKQKPQDYSSRLEYARVLSWGEYYNLSIQEYTEYLRKHPRENNVIFELANVYIWKGDLSLAEAELNRVISLDYKNSEAHLILALVFERSEKYKKAEIEYEKVLQLSKNNKKAKEGLARLKKLEDKINEAKSAVGIKKVIEKTKNYSLYLPLANQLYYTEEKKEEAASYYRLYLEKYPDDYETKLRFAKILSWENLYDESLVLYRVYLDKHPEEIQVRLDMAKVLVWKGDNSSALKELEIVQAQDPSLSEVYLIRGDIYKFDKEYKKAVENYRQVNAIFYNLEAIDKIYEIQKILENEKRIVPELYMRYSSFSENTYNFYKLCLDLGGQIHIYDGSLSISAGLKHYRFTQAPADVQGRELYMEGEINVQENWRWSVALSNLEYYGYEGKNNYSVGTAVQLSPETSLRANYGKRDGVLEMNTLNTLLAGQNLSVDNFSLQVDHRFSDKVDFIAFFSQGVISDQNSLTKFNVGFLHKLDLSLPVKLGGEYEALGYAWSSPYYWTPKTYSTISLVAVLNNQEKSLLLYRLKGKISSVMETAQITYSLDGEASYYLSGNVSAEIALNFSRSTFSASTNILLGLTYHFEK